MSPSPLLDTHAWLWWLDGSPRVSARERRVLDALPPGQRPYLCAISLWEMALLVELGRVALRQAFDVWVDTAASRETVHLLDVSVAIAKELARLPKNFHRDPADRLIVATARAMDLPVLTADTAIRRSKLVRLWKA